MNFAGTFLNNILGNEIQEELRKTEDNKYEEKL